MFSTVTVEGGGGLASPLHSDIFGEAITLSLGKYFFSYTQLILEPPADESGL